MLKDEVSVSESSDEEPSSLDNLPSDSRKIKHKVSNGTGKGVTDIENKFNLFLNSTNNSNENNTSKDNKDSVGLESKEICEPENSCTGELVDLLPLDGSTKIETNATIEKDGEEIEKSNETTESNGLNSVENSIQNFTFTDGEDQSDSLFLEVISTASEDSCEEKLVDLVTLEKTRDEDVVEDSSSSSESPNKSEIKEGSQLPQEESDSNEVIAPQSRSCNIEELNETQIGIRANELGKVVEDLALTLDDKPTDPSDLLVDVLTAVDSVSNGSEKCELNGNIELKADILCEAVEQSSFDKLGENRVNVTSNIATNPVKVDEVTANELRKAVEEFYLNLDNKPTDPSDLRVDVMTVADSVCNDSEKCELNGNDELKADILCERVEQSSLDKLGKNEVPVTSNIAANVQVDEVTVSVMNFIHNYEKKTTDSLNGGTVAEKPMESNSGKPKSLVQELVSDRNRLNDYYYEVFQTYRNENIAGDTSEILELIQDANKLSSADEKCLITETKKDVIPIENKIDLDSWSMKLAGSKLNKVELDSTDESTDSLSDCKLESTPLKVSKTKNTQLDVSSDTPSLLNPIDSPETEDSSSSEYSNKCSKLENALKNKIGYGNRNHLASIHSSDIEDSSTSEGSIKVTPIENLNRRMNELNYELDGLRNKMTDVRNILENNIGACNKGQVASKHSSDTESFSSSLDTESSTSSEGEVTLLERAHREMVEINGKNQTLGEKANVLRSVLDGLESKIPSGRKSKESISDIQIITATHSSKAYCDESKKNNLLHFNKTQKTTKSSSSLSSSSSLENASDAKKSAKSGCSSSESCGKNVNSVQEKYRRFSLSSKTSSDDSESSVSYSGRSNCSEKWRRSKAAKSKTCSRAEKIRIQCPHESFASADQGYFDANPPLNSSHANNSYFNHQSVRPTHEHDMSCYMPSQHQCYSLNGQSSCQSQSCATWYDMFYSQWYFIHQHSSYFQ